MLFRSGRHMSKAFFSGAYEVDEVVAMVRNVYAGRVCFQDFDVQLAPDISVPLFGGHTKGLQCVRLWTDSGWLVLASDASHYLANMEQGRPFPIVAEVTAMVDGWDKLRALAGDPTRIIPGHDPEVMKRFKAPSPAMEGIVVRLDQ